MLSSPVTSRNNLPNHSHSSRMYPRPTRRSLHLRLRSHNNHRCPMKCRTTTSNARLPARTTGKQMKRMVRRRMKSWALPRTTIRRTKTILKTVFLFPIPGINLK